MKFFVKNPNNDFFTNNQIYNNALHEIAHALGFMGHSDDKNNIMYLTRDSITHINKDRAELTEISYQAEPPRCAQDLYALLDSCIQEVLNNKDADSKALIEKAAKDLQNNFLDYER